MECSLINCLFFRMFSIRAWPEIPWSEENFLPIGGARNLTKSSGLKMGLDLLQRRLVFDPYFTHINNEILSRCLHKYIGLEKRKSNENLRSSDYVRPTAMKPYIWPKSNLIYIIYVILPGSLHNHKKTRKKQI